jgi:hypothetical protein
MHKSTLFSYFVTGTLLCGALGAQPATTEMIVSESGVISSVVGSPGTGSLSLHECSSGRTTQGAAPGMICSFSGEPHVTQYLEFRIPDFDPQSLTHQSWHVGHIFQNGSGSSSTLVDTDGLLTAEFSLPSGASTGPVHQYIYVTDTNSAAVRLYLDVYDMTVNQAISMLNNAAMNAIMQTERNPDIFREFSRERARLSGRPDPIGDTRFVAIAGDGLTLEAIAEVVNMQSNCQLQLNEFVYVLQACY